MTFQKAVKEAQGREKIIYGSRSQEWHIIAQSDRDYFSSWALTPEEAKELGEEEAIKK